MTLDDIDRIDPIFQKQVCLNQRQIAQILGVSSSTLENWRTAGNGIGPAYKKIENGKRSRILYDKSALCEWINQSIKTA